MADRPAHAPKALGAGLVAASRIIGQAAQLALMLVAARFLTPAQFGLFSLASAAAVGLRCLAEAGWKEAIVASPDERGVAHAHLMALLVGVALTAAGTGVGLGAAALSPDRTFWNLFAILSATVVFSTFIAAQSGILTRRRRLEGLAMVQIVTELAALGAGIAGFLAGWGVYAFAASRLAAVAIAAVSVVAMTRTFPLCGLRAPGGRPQLRFSLRILAARLLSFAEQNAALFLIGALASPAAAGLYRAGSRLAGAIGETVGEPTRALAWMAFSPRRKDGSKALVPPNPEEIRVEGQQFIKTLLAVYAPLYVGLALVAEPFVHLLLGERWTPAAVVVGALAFRQLLLGPRVMSEPLLAATGRPDWVVRLAVTSLAVTVAAVALTSPFGLTGVAVGQVAAALVMFPIVAWTQSRFAGVSWTAVLSSLGGVAAATMALTAAVVATGRLAPDLPPALLLAAQIATGGCAYAATLLVLDFAWTARTLASIFGKPRMPC